MKFQHNRLSTILGLVGLGLFTTLVTLLILQVSGCGARSTPQDRLADMIRTAAVTSTPAPILTPSPSPTETVSPIELPSPSPIPTPKGLLGGQFDVFAKGTEIVSTEEQYQSENVSITVTRHTENPFSNAALTYFVADIYIQDISSLRTASERGFEKTSTSKIQKLAASVNAILAVNGDYPAGTTNSFIFRNGQAYRLRSTPSRDVLLLYKDGTIQTIAAEDFDPNMDLTDVWQGWQFGPILLDENGEPRRSFPGSRITGNNPRTAFGYYEPGHYCFVVVDGRQGKYSQGLEMRHLARLMYDLGCTQAYNMDGGASSQMVWTDKLYNQPCGEHQRSLSDIIYITEPIYDVTPDATPVPINYKTPTETPAQEAADNP